jgi:hypothetical protein
MKDKLKDWQVRAIKTFIQTFIGTLIPSICLAIGDSMPTNLTGWKTLLVPLVCSATSSAISAAWNIIENGIDN